MHTSWNIFFLTELSFFKYMYLANPNFIIKFRRYLFDKNRIRADMGPIWGGTTSVQELRNFLDAGIS